MTGGGRESYDAVVVGSGPNGLAAAIAIARAGRSVLVLEAADQPGGGLRTAELTLPGYRHDICSAIHPLAIASPFFRSLPLAEHGLRWVEPAVQLAHPLDDRPAAVLSRSLDETAATLGRDGAAYRDLVAPLVARWDDLAADALGPIHVPRHPLLLARFGVHALRSMVGLAEGRFRDEGARSLLAGIAAHATVPLTRTASAAFGLVLAIAGHAGGWPLAAGGSQRIADALVAHLRALGGELRTGTPVGSLDELPAARAVLLDVTPRQVLRICGKRLPDGYRRRLERFVYGPGVFKVDWALREPVPWRDPACRRAGTVHVVGSLRDLQVAEAAAWHGVTPERPYVLVGQQSLFDPSRAPAGRQTLWAYCHVPNGSTEDMTPRMEAQIERFAPGFRDVVLERRAMTTADMERYNANYVGGDISGGANVFTQLFFRPVASPSPYRMPVRGLYLCSSSTPPGGGVHGLCGAYAAEAALRDVL